MTTKFGKGYEGTSHNATRERKTLAHGYWCAECENVGVLPVVFVKSRGTVVDTSCLCKCEAAIVFWSEDCGLMTYSKARQMGIIDENAKTKHAHFMHAQHRSAELREDKRMMQIIEIVAASASPSAALDEILRTASGPLAGTIRGELK